LPLLAKYNPTHLIITDKFSYFINGSAEFAVILSKIGRFWISAPISILILVFSL